MAAKRSSRPVAQRATRQKRGGPDGDAPVAAKSLAIHVEAELSLPSALVQILTFEAERSFDHVIHDPSALWIDLCPEPRPPRTRACYTQHWPAYRFERLGPFFVVPQGHILRLQSDGRRHASIVCRLDATAFRNWIGADIDWTERRLDASLDISNASIRGLLRRLVHEMRHPGLANKAMAELLVGQIAIELGRHFSAVDAPAAVGGLAPWRLRLIDERIAEIRKTPTLSELAQLCNMSARQLARGFRASRGCSIGDQILQTRIDTAKRLLASDQSITAIAAQLGFSSLASFSYAFRRDAGVSPRLFRTRALGQRSRS